MLRLVTRSFTRMHPIRAYCSNSPAGTNEGEQKLTKILKDAFPSAIRVGVEDVSGGCGAMYQVEVVSPDFKGMGIVDQHRKVSEALKAEIKEMHGVRISTKSA